MGVDHTSAPGWTPDPRVVVLRIASEGSPDGQALRDAIAGLVIPDHDERPEDEPTRPRVLIIDPRSVDALSDRLSEGERRSAQRLADPLNRRTCVAAHALRNTLLAQRVGRPPHALGLRAGRFGKPLLTDDAGTPLCFNLSRRPGIAAVAFGVAPLGVDVESLRDRSLDIAAIARRCFTESERARLDALPPGGQRLRGFIETWSRKEAVIKAAGLGLDAMPAIDVSGELAQCRDEAGAQGHYRLRSRMLDEGHCLAQAVRCANPTAIGSSDIPSRPRV